MKILHVAACLCLGAWTAACGTSAATPPADDVTTGQDAATDDAIGSDTLMGDTSGGDVADGLGDTVSYAYATCAAIADCAKVACSKDNSPTCAAACMAGGAPSALPAATALLTCVQSQTSPDKAMQACAKETLACYLAGKTGSKGCFDSMGCISACDKASDGLACFVACAGQMTKPAQDAFIDVAPCLGQDITATAGCEDKVVACLAPTGTQTCAEALGCVLGCGDNGGGNGDPTCTFTCMHNTTAAADKLLFSKLGCDQNDPSCSAGIVQCLAPSGTTSCPDIIGCAMGCSSGAGQAPDMKCLFACIQKGSVASATAAYGELNCMGKSDAACLDKGVACFNPIGTNNCAATTTCVQTCYGAGGDIGACVNGCYGKASAQGFKDFQAWSACHQGCDSSCKSDQTCVNACTSQTCPAAKSACNPT